MAKKLPKFASEAEEQAFWASADSTDFVEWSRAETVTLSTLKPSMRTISLRLPDHLLQERPPKGVIR